LTTFIYAIFWEHYPSPFLGKEVVENVVKGFDYVRSLQSKEHLKEIINIYSQNSINYYSTTKVDFEKQNNYLAFDYQT
jgi:hypothetical protein